MDQMLYACSRRDLPKADIRSKKGALSYVVIESKRSKLYYGKGKGAVGLGGISIDGQSQG
jgi:hypothetical protein